MNNQIRANKILLLDGEGQKVGDFTFKEALDKAYVDGLDLVQVGANKDIAVCKLLKYDSWLYHEKKKREKQEFKNRAQEMKTMNFRPNIGDNDFNVKIKKVSEFLEENHKVKVVIKLKNREFTMKTLNDEAIERITDAVKDIATLDSKINWSPKEINFMLRPEKKVVTKQKVAS